VKLSWNKYAVLAAVFVGSGWLAWALQEKGAWSVLFATPGAIALLGVLYQLVRDEAAHVKALAIQHDQQRFALGITSHMADVAFDRHVALCDEFVQELFSTLQVLMANPQDHEGAKRKADAIGDTIRKHTVWLTPEIQIQLEKFESAVRDIANKSYIADKHPSVGNRQEPLDLLLELIDPGSAYGTPPKRELLYKQIIDLARQMLGVRELTELRGSLLKVNE
jgi:hypothetical protein